MIYQHLPVLLNYYPTSETDSNLKNVDLNKNVRDKMIDLMLLDYIYFTHELVHLSARLDRKDKKPKVNELKTKP